MIEFLASHGIETIVEDRGRVLLKSGKAKQLRDLLVHLATERGVDFFL
jgi:predicted flavoprotein YhiN